MYRGRSIVRVLITSLAVVVASAAIAACGAGNEVESDSGGGSGAAPVSAEIPKSGCGSAATPIPEDPDGVLASLPESAQAQYRGYQSTVRKSEWEDFKVDHGPPYKVALSFAQLTGSTQTGIYNSIKKNLEADTNIKFTGVTTGSQLNIPQQLQQFSSLIDQNPDVLIVEPLTDAFGPLVNKAAKKGIPTISIQGTTTGSPSVINMQSNDYGSGVQGASAVLRQMGGKGNVLYVHGIASSTVDLDAFESFNATLKSCPEAKLAGEVAGAFVPATAKAEVLKFLATHPEKIGGVVETGGMAPGIISAFEQAGRPVPVVNDRAGQKGSLGYWINNTDDYTGFAQGYPPGPYGKSIASVVKRMLAGNGLKIATVTNYFPPITEGDSLDQWAEKSWNLNTPGTSDGPTNPPFFAEDFLNEMFRDPAPAG